jgi:hypothetical protein
MVAPLVDRAMVDDVETVDDEQSLAMAAALAVDEGILAGISTGANVVVANRLAQRLTPDDVVVTIALDSGRQHGAGSHEENSLTAAVFSPCRVVRRTRRRGTGGRVLGDERFLGLAVVHDLALPDQPDVVADLARGPDVVRHQQIRALIPR